MTTPAPLPVDPPPLVWICINGILSRPGDAEGWTDRAVTWLHLRTAGKAEKFEYAAGPLTRRLRQGWRAAAITRMAQYYLRAGYEVSFIAHSNGADLVERVLGELVPYRACSAHLFAPACEGVGLATALQEWRLGRLYLYGSPGDQALRIARASRALLGWAGLGYGDLGLRVEEFARRAPRTTAICDLRHDHSSWFARGEAFESTMCLLLSHETAPFEA